MSDNAALFIAFCMLTWPLIIWRVIWVLNDNARFRKSMANVHIRDAKRESNVEIKTIPNPDIEFVSRQEDFERHEFDEWFSVVNREFVIECLGGRCLKCESMIRLEIDHFQIPKSRGGNFVMCTSSREAISLNIAVLCHKCNYRKGARNYKKFHSAAEILKALSLQEKLLDWIREDDATIMQIREYYDISRAAVIGECQDSLLGYHTSLAEHGSYGGQYQMGIRYRDGLGVKQDYQLASYWFKKAAAQDDGDSLFNLGVLYRDGKGVGKSDTLAREYFMEAAKGKEYLAESGSFDYLLEQGYLSSPSDAKLSEKAERKMGLNWDNITFAILSIVLFVFVLLFTHVVFTYMTL